MNSSKNKPNSKISWLFNLEPNTHENVWFLFTFIFPFLGVLLLPLHITYICSTEKAASTHGAKHGKY